VAFVVVLVDQFVKLAIKFNMQLYDEIPIAGDVFRINFIENKGAAFGLTISDVGERVGLSISDETAKLILTLFSIVAVIVIIYLLKQVRHYRSALPYFLSLILGGAVGNIIDRVFYGVWFAGMNNYEGGLLHGRVVDMFYLNVYQGEIMGQEIHLLPVFNIADAAISIGIAAIILFQRRFFRPPSEPLNPTEPEPDIPERNVAVSPHGPEDSRPAEQSPSEDG
jgi:signal peptidase II